MRTLKDIIIVRDRSTNADHAPYPPPCHVRAQEYAAWWGGPGRDGVMFYNVGRKPLNELGWSFDDWIRFTVAIWKQIKAVKKNPEKFDKNDDKTLLRLYLWAHHCAQTIQENEKKTHVCTCFCDQHEP